MHPNEELARREIELVQAGDLEALEDVYAADLVIHYPGRNPLSGTHHVNEFLSRFEALLGDGTIRCCKEGVWRGATRAAPARPFRASYGRPS